MLVACDEAPPPEPRTAEPEPAVQQPVPHVTPPLLPEPTQVPLPGGADAIFTTIHRCDPSVPCELEIERADGILRVDLGNHLDARPRLRARITLEAGELRTFDPAESGYLQRTAHPDAALETELSATQRNALESGAYYLPFEAREASAITLHLDPT